VRGEHTVTIDRPATVVFDLIADGSRSTSWQPSVIEVTLRSGDGGVGTVWRRLVHGPGGKVADADYVVTECVRPHVYAYEVTAGPVRGTAGYTLSELTPESTTVVLVLTLNPRGALRLLTGFLLRQLVDELDSLDRLKRVLEVPGPPTT
jgi:uncharacterized protein YndB with AHSA1/START domain